MNSLQKEFTVYVDKNGTVEDLLQEAEKEVQLCLQKLSNFCSCVY